MTEMLEALLDEAQGDESHPAMELVDIVGDLIKNYEAEHHPLPEATGVQALKFLMEQKGLRQSDLTEIGTYQRFLPASASSIFGKYAH
ncbi:helix-turn-helix domain-containing protein [Nitrincola sp. A-D6]|uniref:helix-turn-helix domain-containing protein n=1 Tax=Nitrincola sp. A-D6 TaxID=1545442 RepID=UPI00190F23DA|nr:hypothetical protein [Nitrincola sp. A-D6]